MVVSFTTPNGVLTTSAKGVLSIACSRGSPSYNSSTASCSENTIFGASFFRPSVWLRSASADARLAWSRAIVIRKPEAGKSVSTYCVNRACCSAVASGQRTRVILRSRSHTMPESRSTSTVARIHIAPKIGSGLPVTLSAIAPRAVNSLPLSFSACGWYSTIVPAAPPDTGISRGQL